MRSYGNTAFLTEIGNLYRIEKRIIGKVYCWVIIVIQSSSLQITHIR